LAIISHIKCISLCIICTLYSSEHCAFWNFELNEQRQEANCSDVTMNDNRIWPIELQKGWPSMCYRSMNFPSSTKFIRQWTVCTAVLTWHIFCLEESKYFRSFCFDIQTNFKIGNKTVINEFYRHFVCPTVLNIFLPGGRNFMKFDLGILENLPEIFKFYYNMRGITGTLLETLCIFMILSR
jgi:hypothetical protein